MDITATRGEGFRSEKQDCVVIALAQRIKTSYARAHEIASNFRENGKRCRRTKALLMSIGLLPTEFNRTLGSFLKEHQRGCFFVVKKGHAFVVDQGKVFDWKRRGSATKILYFA